MGADAVESLARVEGESGARAQQSGGPGAPEAPGLAPGAAEPGSRAEAAGTNPSQPSGPQIAHEAEVDQRAAEILRQFRVQLNPGLRQATFQLSPAELGRISIRMRMGAGELSAVVKVERSETLDILRRHLPELRATLAQQGIETGDFELSLGFQNSDRGEAKAHTRRRRNARGSSSIEALQAGSGYGAAQLVRSISLHVPAASGGVDTYA